MFFGMCNSPPTFQGFIDKIYYETIIKHPPLGTYVCIYMDKIGIATKVPSFQAHIDAVSDVLRVAQKHSLFFKPEKCIFQALSMEYLGLILECHQTHMDPVKVAGVQDWPMLTMVKGVQSFLGFCNYYRTFIQDFSELAIPLSALTKKGIDFKWGPEEQHMFKELKTHVTRELMLAHPRMDEPFELEVDASGNTIRAMLLQQQLDRTKKPINFLSKMFNQVQRNYNIFSCRILTMMWGL